MLEAVHPIYGLHFCANMKNLFGITSYSYVPDCQRGLEILEEISKWGDQNKLGGGIDALQSKVVLL